MPEGIDLTRGVGWGLGGGDPQQRIPGARSFHSTVKSATILYTAGHAHLLPHSILISYSFGGQSHTVEDYSI
jgi:hypothetical protein